MTVYSIVVEILAFKNVMQWSDYLGLPSNCFVSGKDMCISTNAGAVPASCCMKMCNLKLQVVLDMHL